MDTVMLNPKIKDSYEKNGITIEFTQELPPLRCFGYRWIINGKTSKWFVSEESALEDAKEIANEERT